MNTFFEQKAPFQHSTHLNTFTTPNALFCFVLFLVNGQFTHMYPAGCLPLQWRHTERYGVSNHQPHDCLLKRLFRCGSKKTSRLRVTGLCEWNSPVTGEFPAQRASNAENVSIWWCHHALALQQSNDCDNIGEATPKNIHKQTALLSEKDSLTTTKQSKAQPCAWFMTLYVCIFYMYPHI